MPNLGQQDGPVGDVSETNGQRAGVRHRPGTPEWPKRPQLDANGNSDLSEHRASDEYAALSQGVYAGFG